MAKKVFNNQNKNDIERVQEIALADITLSESNPRKHFHQGKLEELAESIGQHGVIQPVTIRPKGGGYEMVAGERRYRASEIAGKPTIPAIIKEMSDEEAFEIQLVENLQREDVHPMDEARGFARMLGTGRYQVADIAERIDKSESYVLRRMKFNDLIKPLRELFYEDKIKIGHGMELCRLTGDIQNQLYQSYYKDPDGTYYMLPVSDLKETISREFMRELEAAVFDTQDPELYPKAGPCSSCPKRTSNSPSLFGDMAGEDRCTDPACWEMKNLLHLRQLIERYKDEPDYYFIRNYYDPDELIQRELEEEGIKLIKEYDDFRQQENSGIKGVWMGGFGCGKIVGIKLNMTKKQAEEELPREQFIPQEIERIKERQARKIELDREKVQKRIIEAIGAFQPEEEAYEHLGEQLYHDDGWGWKLTVCWILYDGTDWGLQKELWKEWELAGEESDIYVSDIEAIKFFAGKSHDELHVLVCRLMVCWLLSNCTSQSQLDPAKHARAFLLRRVAQEVAESLVKELDAEQAEQAEKREARYEDRLKALQDELQELTGDYPEPVQRLIDRAKEQEYTLVHQRIVVNDAIGREDTIFAELTAKQAVKVWEWIENITENKKRRKK